MGRYHVCDPLVWVGKKTCETFKCSLKDSYKTEFMVLHMTRLLENYAICFMNIIFNFKSPKVGDRG